MAHEDNQKNNLPIISEEDKEKGIRLVCIANESNGERTGCLNCYAYGAPCMNCQEEPEQEFGVMDWHHFLIKCDHQAMRNSCNGLIPASYQGYCNMCQYERNKSDRISHD